MGADGQKLMCATLPGVRWVDLEKLDSPFAGFVRPHRPERNQDFLKTVSVPIMLFTNSALRRTGEPHSTELLMVACEVGGMYLRRPLGRQS